MVDSKDTETNKTQGVCPQGTCLLGKWGIIMHCGIQLGTKSCGHTEEKYLKGLGWRLNEEEKTDARRVHFHLEGTKYQRQRHNELRMACSGWITPKGGEGWFSACFFGRCRWGVGMGVERGVMEVEDVTRCIKRDQLVRSFMCKPRI